jgi:hypothetical protein
MSLPNYIEALNAPTSNGVQHGIINQIRSNVTNSNILSYVIATSYGRYDGAIDNPILLSGPWQGTISAGYWQVEFKNAFVFPTHYSLKGYGEGWTTALEWNLFGFNSENEDYTLLSNDTLVGTNYCGGLAKCKSHNWETFAINNPPQKAFRYFRITHPYYMHFTLSGIEFFGIFSTNGATPSINKKKLNCIISIPLLFRLQTPLFSILLLSRVLKN